MSVSYECDLTAARAAAVTLRDFLSTKGLNDDELFACELSLVEAGNNAVMFARGDAKRLPIVAEVYCSDDQVELKVIDHTAGFDLPSKGVAPPPEIERGRGLFLIQSLMDSVHYERAAQNGVLSMIKRRRVSKDTSGGLG